jgi:ribosomal protein S18 acetylase RimI-like enzyme
MWLAYIMEEPVAVCVVSYAISTSIGGVVAKVDDVYVSRRRQRRGIATQMLEDLIKELRKRNILRIDTAVHKRNHGAAKFYSKLGFERLDEERLALVL